MSRSLASLVYRCWRPSRAARYPAAGIGLPALGPLALWPLTLQHPQHGAAQAGRRIRHGDSRRSHRLDLVLGPALAAGDNGPGMSHAPSRRRGAAGDETHHRLLALCGFQQGRGLFLGAAADLADHDDGLGLLIVQEQLQAIDEAGAVDRIAADADAG